MHLEMQRMAHYIGGYGSFAPIYSVCHHQEYLVE